MMVVVLGIVMEPDDAPCASSLVEDEDGAETAERYSLSSVSSSSSSSLSGAKI